MNSFASESLSFFLNLVVELHDVVELVAWRKLHSGWSFFNDLSNCFFQDIPFGCLQELLVEVLGDHLDGRDGGEDVWWDFESHVCEVVRRCSGLYIAPNVVICDYVFYGIWL